MSSRTRSRNAYASALNGAISAGDTTIVVDSGSGLTHPVYLTLAPSDPAKREVIRVNNVSGATLSSVTRGLAGSASGAQSHVTGTEIRAIPVHQTLDEIFDDIEDLEAADTAHFGGTDTADHPEATGSVRGFISATDKAKLDGIAAGATAVTGGNAHDHVGGDGAQINHANTSNLTVGDPHTQYLLKAGVAADVPDHLHTSAAEGGALTGVALLAAWPVGSIFIAAVATNPNTLLGGGTWAAFGAGRVLVSRDAGDVDFDTAEETGGAKTHTHTGGAHAHTMDTHSHAISGTTSSNGAHDHGGTTSEANSVIGSLTAYTTGANEHRHDITNQAAHNHTFSDTSSAVDPGDTNSGGAVATAAGTTVQPYIVVYMWKRTA